MDHTHRKVELQSPSDLQHLVSNASAAARARIDKHFPPHPPAAAAPATPSDPMRRQVEELVQSFIEQTFAAARANISVNGLEGADMERALRGAADGSGAADLEPFDHLLARRVQAVSSAIEALQLQLADLRRTAPVEGRRVYVADVERSGSEWEARMARAEEEERGLGEVELDVKGLERVGEMARSWDEGTKRLVEVKSGIGGVAARLDKAKAAIEYLKETRQNVSV